MIKIETYYDIGCDRCGKHRSSDFNQYEMETSKVRLRKFAKKEGWTFNKETNETLCLECSNIE